MTARSFLALPLLLPALVGCGNPAIDNEIALLPNDGVTPSDFHRAGQPCLLCHGPYKGAFPEMIIAGSVFARQPKMGFLPVPVAGVKIKISDSFSAVTGANGALKRDITTNCAGNFFLTHDDVVQSTSHDTIGFPLKVEIECGGLTLPMKGRIARDGSCAGCHNGGPALDSPGWVVCNTDAPPPTKQTCPKLFQ